MKRYQTRREDKHFAEKASFGVLGYAHAGDSGRDEVSVLVSPRLK